MLLYGVSPCEGKTATDHDVLPVMTLQSRIIAMRDVTSGESVGYGSRWIAKRNSRIAVVSIGYGDGYPSEMPDGAPVLVNGQLATIAGRVSMDMITIDVTDVPDVNIGDVVTLWGEGLPVEQVATFVRQSPYVLLTGVSARVTRQIS